MNNFGKKIALFLTLYLVICALAFAQQPPGPSPQPSQPQAQSKSQSQQPKSQQQPHEQRLQNRSSQTFEAEIVYIINNPTHEYKNVTAFGLSGENKNVTIAPGKSEKVIFNFVSNSCFNITSDCILKNSDTGITLLNESVSLSTCQNSPKVTKQIYYECSNMPPPLSPR